MPFENDPARRAFLKSLGSAALASAVKGDTADQSSKTTTKSNSAKAPIPYPRTFTGPHLKMISFPLGGVCAGSIGLGGRGQFRDWEIFNRPDKGNSPQHAFASVWVQQKGSKPKAHVLESRIETPYEGQDGLGSQNAPGLSRLQGATFTGEFPRARVDFHDDRLPVKISLEAGTPFIPLDADESGLPLAVLRYRIRNVSRSPVTAAIALSIENPIQPSSSAEKEHAEARTNQKRTSNGMNGLLMNNPALAATDAGNGTFAMAVLDSADGHFTSLQGWPAGRWWNSPLLFWDDFSSDGELGPEAEKPGPVGAVCLNREIAPGAESEYLFLLSWHFPNRTPKRCGWDAPKGHEQTIIGNWYTTRFNDAWAVAEYAASHLEQLEQRTQRFVQAVRETTLPGAIKDAAMANLSTLVSTTCFRTADSEFHAFEGSDNHIGCCFGNCTHVWNYETATAHIFPSFSRSLRRSAFGYSMDERGGMYFRQLLPDGLARFGFIAADGQMGQIMKVYMDWQLSGDRQFLEEFWPKVKRAISFAWIPGGWDANRDGVMEGVQHNTYDVEFYGPNPLCGVYYLGALRACEEMALAMNDDATEYRRLFESGKAWIDSKLFNGSFYIQKIEGHPASEIANGLRGGMGADDPEKPQYQVGAGCLLDQLLAQYLADVAGLGTLVDSRHIETTLDSIYRFNHKANLLDHDSVQRTYALNDEAATVVCDYANAERPKIPFPYYAEVWTGLEYSTASLMIFRGMTSRGLECFTDARRRYDGERRNPWDEPECGHHYARAMASWSGFLAASGFRYKGQSRRIEVSPRFPAEGFHSFWSNGTGWGTFNVSASEFSITPDEGFLMVREMNLPMRQDSQRFNVQWDGKQVAHRVNTENGRLTIVLDSELKLAAGSKLSVSS
ncbi:MAG: GH116 family glycosyl-hydrolase [Bryobacteraceae bacterium]